ncbi:MAG: tRNA (adenosine(37)-N6)-threonylcarbamoyltransferase complex ATPase subunit type 1 TsaE [Bacteroidia bacterium]|nr:tRNA (adenosine(37)-N6)-threonylcarbamoyltransferase complex ATPase subunit type 1 TsaE [Bacteroidia bacterium]
MVKTITIENIEQIEKAAKEFIEYISASTLESNIFAFYGQMGAGKTTFIKAICNALQVDDLVSSPTFTIVNEYKAAKGFPIYHFDFYRLNNPQEAYDIGIDEYFNGQGLCLIEWPEKIADILPDNCIKVCITVKENLQRVIEIS